MQRSIQKSARALDQAQDDSGGRRTNVNRTIVMILAVLATAVSARGEITPQEIMKMSPVDIEAALPNEHPSSYYLYAARLFEEGHKDDAVWWFYVGQLRYRIHLIARPDLDPSGDPALFASYNATIGQLINEYAGGSVADWVAAIDRALAWDEAHSDGFTPKSEFLEVRAEARKGLVSLRDKITQSADQVREQRQANGLENRD